MIHVKHHLSEPEKLKKRKIQSDKGIPDNPRNAWSNFGGKPELIKDLLRLQKGLCAYCENKLNNELGYHVEHIEPKSLNPHLTFEYTNLILSCFSSDLLSSSYSISCGHARGNKFNSELFISPTLKDCENYFWYELYGKIVPNYRLNDSDTCKANYTINLLNLNCLRLIRERENIIEEGFVIIQELIDNQYALENFLELEFHCARNEYLFPYINLRKQFFQNYMMKPTTVINKLAQE